MRTISETKKRGNKFLIANGTVWLVLSIIGIWLIWKYIKSTWMCFVLSPIAVLICAFAEEKLLVYPVSAAMMLTDKLLQEADKKQ